MLRLSCSSGGCISTPLHAFLSSLEDTCSCNETASPHVVIDVLIYLTGVLRGQYKAPADGSTNLPGLGVPCVCSLYQLEFLSPADGRRLLTSSLV